MAWQCDLEILGLLVQTLIGLFKASLGTHLLMLAFKSFASIFWFTRVLKLELGRFGVTDLETWKCCWNSLFASSWCSCYFWGVSTSTSA